MDISFCDPKNKILIELMESFSPGVWEHSAVSGGLACALYCSEYRPARCRASTTHRNCLLYGRKGNECAKSTFLRSSISF